MCAILSCDGRNAFNIMFGSNILPAVAFVARDLVVYADDLYAKSLPNLLYHMEDGFVQAIRSSRDV